MTGAILPIEILNSQSTEKDIITGSKPAFIEVTQVFYKDGVDKMLMTHIIDVNDIQKVQYNAYSPSEPLLCLKNGSQFIVQESQDELLKKINQALNPPVELKPVFIDLTEVFRGSVRKKLIAVATTLTKPITLSVASISKIEDHHYNKNGFAPDAPTLITSTTGSEIYIQETRDKVKQKIAATLKP